MCLVHGEILLFFISVLILTLIIYIITNNGFHLLEKNILNFLDSSFLRIYLLIQKSDLQKNSG